jgi:hypothetical protein
MKGPLGERSERLSHANVPFQKVNADELVAGEAAYILWLSKTIA